MNVDQNFRRRVRIVGKPEEIHGYMMEVRDAETGEAIENVYCAEITLHVNRKNVAELHYYEADKASGRLLKGEHGPVQKSVVVENPEIDITAIGEGNGRTSQ